MCMNYDDHGFEEQPIFHRFAELSRIGMVQRYKNIPLPEDTSVAVNPSLVSILVANQLSVEGITLDANCLRVSYQ